jgi:ribose transport system substrate-binding protein
MAYLGVKVLDEMHHQNHPALDTNFKQDSSSPYPASVYTGTLLVGKDNLQAFMSQKQPQANPAPKP